MTAVPLDFTDISGTGTLVAGADNTDDGWSTTTVGIGFTFNFYGNDFTAISINHNGILTFGATTGFTAWENEALPANVGLAPNNAIYPLWDDLDGRRTVNPTAFLRSQTQGAFPNRVFIVQWTATPQYNAGLAGTDTNTFQVKIHETTNVIEFHYQVVGAENANDAFPGTVIGIENSNGTEWVQYDTMATCRASLNGGNTALRFAPTTPCEPVVGCTCLGDANGDTAINGKDVMSFAQCAASGGAGCPCADMNNSGTADSGDVSAFVTRVLSGVCPP